RGPEAALLVAAYASGAVIAVLSVVDPEHPVALSPPYREIGPVAGPALAAGWVVFRTFVMWLAVWYAWRAWRAAGPDGARRGQLAAVLATIACGTVGGTVMIVLRQLGGPDWPGTTLIALSLVLAAYGVFVQRVFLAPDVARRSFYYALGTGLVTAAYVSFLLGLERLSRDVLAIQAPLVTALALVLTIALFDPLRDRVRAVLDRNAERRDLSYRRLLRALGDQLLTSQRPDAAIEPALARLCRTLGAPAAAVYGDDGQTIAAYGVASPAVRAALTLPLRAGDREFGRVVFGPKGS